MIQLAYAAIELANSVAQLAYSSPELASSMTKLASYPGQLV
jgi:hypothetical protein